MKAIKASTPLQREDLIKLANDEYWVRFYKIFKIDGVVSDAVQYNIMRMLALKYGLHFNCKLFEFR